MRTLQGRIIAWVMMAALLVAIIPVQNQLTRAKSPAWFTERMSYLPSSDNIRRVLPGYESTYANYLWIRTVLYFGTHYLTDRDFPWLITMVDMVTRLNPYFYPSYEFAALMIPDFCHNPDAARIILHRGVTALGHKNYKLPFYLGWLYYKHYDNREQAAIFLSLAARNPQAPPYIAGLAATMYQKAGRRNESLLYMQSLYATTENPRVKEYLRQKMSTM